MDKKEKRFACEYCHGATVKRVMRVPFQFRGQTIYVDRVPLWVCARCGEKYFDAPVYKRLEEIAKRRETFPETISFPLACFGMALR